MFFTVHISFAQFDQGSCAVYLTSKPSAADIYIDGVSAGKKTPGMISGLSPGRHKILLEWGEYIAEKEVTLEEGVFTRHELTLKLKPVKIRIESSPATALVIMNSREIGRTPIEASLENTGSANFSFQVNGFLPLDTLIYFAERTSYSLNIKMVPAGFLKVTSIPEGTDVFFDNKFIGRSPLEVQVETGSHNLQLMTGDFDVYSQDITIKQGKTIEFNAVLQKLNGKLTIEGLPDGISIFLNGKHIGSTPIQGYELDVGEYSIKYSAAGFEPQDKDYSVVIVQNSDEFVTIEAAMKTVAGAVWRSAVAPGWGQRYEERENIGYLYLAGEIALVAAATASVALFNQASDNYAIARDEYSIQVEEDEIIRTKKNMESRYDEVERYAQYRNGLVRAAVGLWLWNVVDAYIGYTPPALSSSPLQGKMEVSDDKLTIKLTWDL